MTIPFTESGTTEGEVAWEKDNEFSLLSINFYATLLWIHSVSSQKYGSGAQGKYASQVIKENKTG